MNLIVQASRIVNRGIDHLPLRCRGQPPDAALCLSFRRLAMGILKLYPRINNHPPGAAYLPYVSPEFPGHLAFIYT